MAPSLSVIVPTYNRSHVLPRALASLRAQTRPADAVIVVDDGSNDGTARYLQELAEEGLTCVRLERNQGVAAARNVGIKRAETDLVAFLDSDDVQQPPTLERLCDLLATHPDVDAAFCDVSLVESPGGPVIIRSLARRMSRFSTLIGEQPSGGVVIVDQPSMYLCLLQEVPVKPSALVVRRSTFEEVGDFREDLRSAEDWEWLLRLSKRTAFGFVDQALVQQTHLEDATHTVHREADLQAVISFLAAESRSCGDAHRSSRTGIARAAQNLASHYLAHGRPRDAFVAYGRGFVYSHSLSLAIRAPLAWLPLGVRGRLQEWRHGVS